MSNGRNENPQAKTQEISKIAHALSSLQRYIIDGELRSGTELPSEKELAEQLGISRFILREALRVAQYQGLVDIGRGAKTRVSEFSIQPAVEIFEILLRRSPNILLDLTEARQALECNIVELAAVRADSSLINAMKDTIINIQNNLDNIDLCVEKDYEFHNLIVEASNNVVFKIMLNPLTELLKKSRKETFKKYGAEGVKHHKNILEAIFERNPEKARAAMWEHLEQTKRNLLDI